MSDTEAISKFQAFEDYDFEKDEKFKVNLELAKGSIDISNPLNSMQVWRSLFTKQ